MGTWHREGQMLQKAWRGLGTESSHLLGGPGKLGVSWEGQDANSCAPMLMTKRLPPDDRMQAPVICKSGVSRDLFRKHGEDGRVGNSLGHSQGAKAGHVNWRAGVRSKTIKRKSWKKIGSRLQGNLHPSSWPLLRVVIWAKIMIFNGVIEES